MSGKLSSFYAVHSEERRLADLLAPGDLFPGQVEALQKTGLLSGGSVLIVAPTGSGKSLLAEAAMLPALARRQPVLWLVPTRTLARERAAALGRALGPAGYRVVATSRDDRAADEDILTGRVDVAVAVYEKAQALMLQSPGFRAAFAMVVADEVQLTCDPERGLAAELLLTLLRRRKEPPRLVALTSEIPVPRDFAGRHGLELFEWNSRPVPLRTGHIVLETGRVCWREGEREECLQLPATIAPHEEVSSQLAPIVEHFPRPLLLFVPSRWQARHYAQELARARPRREGVELLPPAEDTTELGGILRELLPAGVALHTAELTGAQRRLVETALTSGAADICVCTTTLAEGVNVGARTVLVVPTGQPQRNYPLHSLFGRAGRPGAGPGQAYVLIRRESDRRQLDFMLRVDKPMDLAVASPSQRLQAAALLLSPDQPLDRRLLLRRLQSIPVLKSLAQDAIREGLEKGFWEEKDARLQLLPAGVLLAQGGLDADVILGWRTMLRRFPEGGGAVANVFLALGGGQTCRALSLPQEERLSARWPAAMLDELAADKSPMAEYFRRFLYETDRLPLALHQAAKGTLLLLEHGRGAQLPRLEADFELAAGLIEDHCANYAFLVAQLQRLARLLGSELALPEIQPSSPTAHANSNGHQADDQRPAEPVLVIRRGTTGSVEWCGKRVDLTRLQFRMLELLARNAGDGVPYERLERYVWPDAHVERQQVSYHRRRLEEQLGAPLIETQASWGLRLRLEREQVRFEEVPAAPILQRPWRLPTLNSLARLIRV